MVGVIDKSMRDLDSGINHVPRCFSLLGYVGVCVMSWRGRQSYFCWVAGVAYTVKHDE